jgi:prepilin-type N-terminal cleavage/methylation domain-containing protein
MIKKNSRGFTLIELLVVIAIIGLLSTLSIVALNNARQKARDAVRVASIKQMQTALELFYSDAGIYPPSTGPNMLVVPGGSIATSGTVYMGIIPSNPSPWADGACSSGADVQWTYTRDGVGGSYHIKYCLAASVGGTLKGVHYATPFGHKNP